MSKYWMSETDGDTAQNIGEVKTIEELPEFSQATVRNDPLSTQWYVAIPDANGLTLHIKLVD